jgi:hypothetical protein
MIKSRARVTRSSWRQPVRVITRTWNGFDKVYLVPLFALRNEAEAILLPAEEKTLQLIVSYHRLPSQSLCTLSGLNCIPEEKRACVNSNRSKLPETI